MELLIILGVAAVLVLFLISQYNKLIRLNVAVDEAWAQIEVQLKRRSDLIPNLVETVKGYAAHESATFEKVVQARAAATSATALPDVAAADGMLTQALRGLLAVAENYPDLKASANFLLKGEEVSNHREQGELCAPVLQRQCSRPQCGNQNHSFKFLCRIRKSD